MGFTKPHPIRDLKAGPTAQDVDDNFDSLFNAARALKALIEDLTARVDTIGDLAGVDGLTIIGPPGQDGEDGWPGAPGQKGDPGVSIIGPPGLDGADVDEPWITDGGNSAKLQGANVFTAINPLTTPAESWVGPSSTTGVYFEGGNVGIGTTSPYSELSLVGASPELSILSNTAGDNDPSLFLSASTFETSQGLKLWHDRNVGASYIDSLFDNVAGDIYIRTKTAGTPVDALFIESIGNVGIGTTGPAAQLHVDQSSTTIAIPVLILDQADDSEEMIEFVGTIGTGNSIEAVGAKTLTTTHFIKVTLPGGLTRYFPVGTIA